MYFTLQGWMIKISLSMLCLDIFWVIYFISKCINYIKIKEKCKIITYILLSLSGLIVIIGQLYID